MDKNSDERKKYVLEFPAGWKAGQWWKLFQRVCPDQLEEAKLLVIQHGRSLGVLFEEVVHLMHRTLEPAMGKLRSLKVRNPKVNSRVFSMSIFWELGAPIPRGKPQNPQVRENAGGCHCWQGSYRERGDLAHGPIQALAACRLQPLPGIEKT